MEEDEPVDTMELGPVHRNLIIKNTENGAQKENGDIFKNKDFEEVSEKNMPMAPSQIFTTTSSQNQLRTKRKLSYTKPIKTQFSSASMSSEKYKLGSTETFGRRLSGGGPRRNFSTSSFAHISTPFHGSTLSAFEKPNEFASQFSLRSITESVTDAAYCCFCCKQNKSDSESNAFFDISLLRDPAYLVILFSSSTVAISCTNFLILLPSFAQNVGFDKDKGALLLSTVSALDLVGRIGGSTLCDLNLIPKPVYFIGGLVVSGIALAVLPFLHTYLMISIFCAIFGLASGINNSVTTLIMAEILGIERLMSTYGISLFVNGILQLVGPFVCGIWFQRDQNFVNMFLTFGLIFLAGASLWAFMPLINKRKKMHEAMHRSGV